MDRLFHHWRRSSCPFSLLSWNLWATNPPTSMIKRNSSAPLLWVNVLLGCEPDVWGILGVNAQGPPEVLFLCHFFFLPKLLVPPGTSQILRFYIIIKKWRKEGRSTRSQRDGERPSRRQQLALANSRHQNPEGLRHPLSSPWERAVPVKPPTKRGGETKGNKTQTLFWSLAPSTARPLLSMSGPLTSPSLVPSPHCHSSIP